MHRKSKLTTWKSCSEGVLAAQALAHRLRLAAQRLAVQPQGGAAAPQLGNKARKRSGLKVRHIPWIVSLNGQALQRRVVSQPLKQLSGSWRVPVNRSHRRAQKADMLQPRCLPQRRDAGEQGIDACGKPPQAMQPRAARQRGQRGLAGACHAAAGFEVAYPQRGKAAQCTQKRTRSWGWRIDSSRAAPDCLQQEEGAAGKPHVEARATASRTLSGTFSSSFLHLPSVQQWHKRTRLAVTIQSWLPCSSLHHLSCHLPHSPGRSGRLGAAEHLPQPVHPPHPLCPAPGAAGASASPGHRQGLA